MPPATGKKGFLATTNDYDLIILDLMLPQLDGITLCRQLRKNNSSIPVLMLTARDAVKDKVRGLDAGAIDESCPVDWLGVRRYRCFRSLRMQTYAKRHKVREHRSA